MPNELVSRRAAVNTLSINNWVRPYSNKNDRTEVLYSRIYRPSISEISSKSLSKAFSGPIKLDRTMSTRQFTPELAAVRMELSLKRATGESLTSTESQTLKVLNNLASLNMKRDSSEIESLKDLSSELDDIIAVINNQNG